MSRSAAILAAALIAIAGACHRESGAANATRPPALVETAVVESADVALYLDEIGTCEASEKVTIQPQVTGRILKRHFEDGADLRIGDPLFTIESASYEAALARAQAELAENRAKLAQAQTDFERVKDLVERGAVSREEFESRRNQVAVSQAQAQASDAAVASARVDLDYCNIASPIEGRAGRRLVDVGNVVRQSDDAMLLVIERIEPIYADFSVPERELDRVRLSQLQAPCKVEVRASAQSSLPSSPGAPSDGESQDGASAGVLTFIDNAVQPSTGTIKLRATLSNADRKLWPGQFVRVRLILGTLPNAVLAPASAVQISSRGAYVYVVKPDSTAEMRPVVQGQRQGDRVVILGGLAAGEKVVTEGHVLVAPGAPVREKPPAKS